MTTSHHRRLGAGLLLVGLVALTPFPALAWRPFVTPQGKFVRWDAPEVFVRVATGWGELLGDAAVAAAVTRAVAAWDDPDCAEPVFDVLAPFPDAILDDTDGRVSIVPIADSDAWNARFGALELARTLVTYRVTSGAMLDADIAVNLGGFEFSPAEECAAESYDMQSMLVHELGHVLGLDHSADTAATMFQRTDPGVCDIRDLADDDREGLCALYPPPEPPPDPAPEPGPEPVPEPRAEPQADVAVELDLVGGRPRDWGCQGAGGGGPVALAGALLALSRLRRRRYGPRASA